MALDANVLASAIEIAVQNAYVTEFDVANFSDPPTENEIKTAMGKLVAAAAAPILSHIKTSADLTGITSGIDTVYGGVD